MIAKQKYGIAVLFLMGSSLRCVTLSDCSNEDDLLGGYDQMAQSLAQDAQELRNLLDAFSNLTIVLNNVTENRQATFNSYSQQLLNYQNLLQQEQENLALLQAQGVADQADVQNQIDAVTEQGNMQIENLQSSIDSLQDAITLLQQNLATITNLTQSRVDSVNNMLNSYSDFEDVRLNFKDQLDALLEQIRAYIGMTAAQDALLQ